MKFEEHGEIIKYLLLKNSVVSETYPEQQHRLLENAIEEISDLRKAINLLTNERNLAVRRLDALKGLVDAL